MEVEKLQQNKKDVKFKAFNALSSKTIQNAPSEKLVEMREAFEDRLE